MILALFLGGLARAEPPVEDTPSRVAVGPVDVRGTVLALPTDLALARCVAPLPAAAVPLLGAEGGQLTLTLRVRRNQVAVVTTVQADPAVAPLGPCFERKLAEVTWPVRRARFDVPITVAPARE